jgi:anti-sigma factor RsiW
MNAAPPPAQADDPELEQLVAYLDGELDAAATGAVEQRLTQDAGYRQLLRQLQQSWDLLDRLPKAHVDQSFTQSTVAMVVVKAADDVEQLQAVSGRRRRYTWWFGTVGIALAFLFGYAAVARWAGRENRQLLRDLPVIEKLDQYRYAESVEFLRMLEREGLFVEEEADHEPVEN